MKINKTFVLLFGILVSLSVFGQQKIGHINSRELLSLMPESDSAQKKLEEVAKQNQLAYEEMTVEFNKKLEEYQQNFETYTDLVKATKEADLQDMQRKIEVFQQTMQEDMRREEMKLMQPIQEKAVNAVNEVAEEQGYTYIIDSGLGVIVYTGDDASDILPLVKAKLGLE